MVKIIESLYCNIIERVNAEIIEGVNVEKALILSFSFMILNVFLIIQLII